MTQIIITAIGSAATSIRHRHARTLASTGIASSFARILIC